MLLTWSDLCHDGPDGLQDQVVDDLLLVGELAVGGEGAGDVRGVAVVLSAHVHQAAHRHTTGARARVKSRTDERSEKGHETCDKPHICAHMS